MNHQTLIFGLLAIGSLMPGGCARMFADTRMVADEGPPELAGAPADDSRTSPPAAPLPDEKLARRAQPVAVSPDGPTIPSGGQEPNEPDERLRQMIRQTDDPVVKRFLTQLLESNQAQRGRADGAEKANVLAPSRGLVVLNRHDHESIGETESQSSNDFRQEKYTPTADADRAPAEPTERAPASSQAVRINVNDRRDDGTATQLASASVPAAAPRSTEHTISATERSTTRPWNDSLDETIRLLEQKLRDQDQELSTDQRVRLEAALRLLDVVAGDRRSAVRPITGADDAHRDYWQEQLYGLTVYFNDHDVPLADHRATLALQHLRRATDHLAAASSLEVRNLAFCTQVDSFGRYTEFPKYEFKPDQEVLLYVEVDNFTAEQLHDKQGHYETALQGSYQVVDLNQRKVAEHRFLLEKEICRNRRRDFFIPYRMYLPRINPGRYKLQLTIEDTKGKKMGAAPALDFSIVN